MINMVETVMINWGYVIALFILGFITYKRKSLDLLGSLTMVLMGIVIIFFSRSQLATSFSYIFSLIFNCNKIFKIL